MLIELKFDIKYMFLLIKLFQLCMRKLKDYLQLVDEKKGLNF